MVGTAPMIWAATGPGRHFLWSAVQWL